MTHVRSPWMVLMLATFVAGASTGCANNCSDSSIWDRMRGCDSCDTGCCGAGMHQRSLAIPDTYPLGAVNRAHYHVMQTNAEAADFILHRHEFQDQSAELTPFGKDHIVEIAARARSAPFPVIIERSEHNSDPELDEHRRNLIARVLMDFGVPEADQRTIVAPAYGPGINSREAEYDYYSYIYTRGFNGAGGTFNQMGSFSGVGGGVGGVGFGQ